MARRNPRSFRDGVNTSPWGACFGKVRSAANDTRRADPTVRSRADTKRQRPKVGAVRILVVGAHPDDIEIGAGALVAKAVDRGMEIHLLVLTDDGADTAARRAEAVAGAQALGV